MRSKKLLRLPLLLLLATGLYASALLAIETPRDLRGTEIRQNTVKWEWASVSEAKEYEVTVNGQSRGRTKDVKFYSYDLNAGDHTMNVRSVDWRGNASERTQTVRIRVSDTFKFGTHGRSTLVSGGSSSNSLAISARSSSGSFGTPQNPRGTETSAYTVTWGWDTVSGAVEYEVTVDGKYAGKTRSTSWKSDDLWSGNHSMTVKAINSAGSRSEQSATVKVAVKGRAGSTRSNTSNNSSAPVMASSSGSSFSGQVLGLSFKEYAGGDIKWRWNSFSGARQYEATVDGKVVGTTSSTEWVSRELWNGSHSLTVKAIDSSGRKTEQSATLKIRVRGDARESLSGGSVAAQAAVQNDLPAPPPPQSNGTGDPSAASVESLIDPASYNYSEVSNKSGYELVFSDEFNGTALNPYRWHSQLRWDGEWNGERYEYRVVNGEDQFYVNVLSPDSEHQKEIVPVYNPFKFNGQHLSIKAKVNPLKSRDKTRTYGKLDDMAKQQQFLSGAISTHKKFARKYGYFEARIRIPDHVGTFPAFWLFHEKRAWEGTQRTEIDIMENLGHAPEYVYNSFHYFKNVSRTYGGDANFIKPKPSGQIHNGTDFSRDFHTYAVDWSPGRVIWYIDGVKVSELYNEQVNFEELYVMLNLAMGGNWTNFPKNAGGLGRPSNERFPTSNDLREFRNPSLDIDYVRVYRRK